MSSMARNLSKTTSLLLADRGLDPVAADLVRQAGQNPDVAELLCDLCESHGSGLDCTRAWIESVIPIIGEQYTGSLLQRHRLQ